MSLLLSRYLRFPDFLPTTLCLSCPTDQYLKQNYYYSKGGRGVKVDIYLCLSVRYYSEHGHICHLFELILMIHYAIPSQRREKIRKDTIRWTDGTLGRSVGALGTLRSRTNEVDTIIWSDGPVSSCVGWLEGEGLLKTVAPDDLTV
jgi:hypothetical protein